MHCRMGLCSTLTGIHQDANFNFYGDMHVLIPIFHCSGFGHCRPRCGLWCICCPPPKGASGAAVAADDKVHCYNINSCKGTAECRTTANECKGQNACKGQGFKAETAKSCLGKGGVIGDIKS